MGLYNFERGFANEDIACGSRCLGVFYNMFIVIRKNATTCNSRWLEVLYNKIKLSHLLNIACYSRDFGSSITMSLSVIVRSGPATAGV